MSLEIKLRITAGIVMVALIISIILSDKKELNLLLLTLIQCKVFHELRQVNLTSFPIHLEKTQLLFDWALFIISMSLSLHLLYTDHATILIWYLFSYTQWFMAWVCLVLDKNVNKKQNNSNLAAALLHTFYVHVILLYTTIQPAVIHLNIKHGGIFWFLFPCSLVVCNDTAAFVCGRWFGKHKLLNVSPNKTVEGFIGACVITVLFGYVFSGWLSQFDSLLRIGHADIYKHIQYHGIILALFSSIYAPFGGYFTSAIKRAGHLKDFGNFIPGHGGLTDRVDCQLFLSLFTFVYFNYITQ